MDPWVILEAAKRFTNEGLMFRGPNNIFARVSGVPGTQIGDAVSYLRRAEGACWLNRG